MSLLLLGQRLRDDRCGGDHHDRAQIHAVHVLPSEPGTNLVTEEEHQSGFQRGDDEGGETDLPDLAEVEFQPDVEEQEHDADFRQGLHTFLRRDQGMRQDVGSDQHAGDDVTEDDRLLELAEDDSHHAGHQHDHREILQKVNFICCVLHGGNDRSAERNREAFSGVGFGECDQEREFGLGRRRRMR